MKLVDGGRGVGGRCRCGGGVPTTTLVLLLLALAVAGAAATGAPSASLEIVLGYDDAQGMLGQGARVRSSWVWGGAGRPRPSPRAAAATTNNAHPTCPLVKTHTHQPTSLFDPADARLVRGRELAGARVRVRAAAGGRVFRLLQPSARLACSPECGRVTIASVDDNREWVLPEEEGLVVRRLEGEGSSPASCGGAAVAGFPWSGGEGTTTLLHALILRAEATNASTTKPSQSLIPRAAALLLFLGLNVAAAAVSSSSSLSPR